MATVISWLDPTRPKLPPGALLAIADDLLADLYTIWLRLRDMCRLDSAVCAKWLRPDFRRLVSTKVLRFLREEIELMSWAKFRTIAHEELSLEKLRWISKRGIHLASLCIPGYEDEQESIRTTISCLVDEGLIDKLETIDLFGCKFFKDADFAAILGKSYASIKCIDIQDCKLTENSITHIKRCINLEGLAAYGDESPADMVEVFQSCPKLRKLDLQRFRDILTIQGVADHCPLLENLNIRNCSAVSDEIVVSLCKHCVRLKILCLDHCVRLTDQSVLAIAERLPNLVGLSITGVSNITSSAIETLASRCRELEKLSVSECTNVSDMTLFKISDHCTKLKKLFVVGCPVSPFGIGVIATRCPELKELRLHRSAHSDYAFTGSFSSVFPKVKVIEYL